MSMNKAFKKVINDVLKVGTFFIVTQLLANKPLTDKAWQTEALNTLIGFAVYELVVARFVDPKMFVILHLQLMMLLNLELCLLLLDT